MKNSQTKNPHVLKYVPPNSWKSSKNIHCSKHSIYDKARHTHTISVSHCVLSKGLKKKKKHHHQLYHAFSSNMLVSNIRPALTLIYKLGGKSDFGVKPKHTHTKRKKKTKQKSLVYIQTLKIEHAGHNRG